MAASNQPARSDVAYYSGTPARDADYVYTGTMIGPWATPVPVSFVLRRRENITTAVVSQSSVAAVDVPAVSTILLSPAVPSLFRPPAMVSSPTSVVNTGIAFGASDAILQIGTLGVITINSTIGAFTVSDLVGVPAGASMQWVSA